MADFNDVVTNEHIQAIADAVRRLTGLEESLTVPEIVEILGTLYTEAIVGAAKVGRNIVS